MTTRVAPQLIDQTNGIGYTAGAGGTVTQDTDKSNPVTINKPCGKINTHTSALGAGARVAFVVNNSLAAINDVIVVHVAGNTAGVASRYRADCTYVNAGLFYITLENFSGGSHSEVVEINFAIIKSAVS